MLRSSAKQVPRPSMGGCGRGRRALAACCYVPAAARKCSRRDRMVCGCWAGGLTAAPAGSRRGMEAAPAARIPCETSSVSRPGEVWGQGWCCSSGLSSACWAGGAGGGWRLLFFCGAGGGAGVVGGGGAGRGFRVLLEGRGGGGGGGRVAGVDEDPAWILRETGIDPLRRRVTESLFTLGAGGIATRGSVEEAVPGDVPLVLAAGIYDGTGQGQHLLPGPGWTGLAVEPAPAQDVRVLDLRTGVLARTEQGPDAFPLRSLRLASITIPGVVAMRAETLAGRLRPGVPFRRPLGKAMAGGRQDGAYWAGVDADCGGGISALAVQRLRRDGQLRTVERVASYVTCQRRRPEPGEAADALRVAEDLGFDRLLAGHRAAWAARWEAVDVRIPDDPAAQLALRFALFQLWCNTRAGGELAVGAQLLLELSALGDIAHDGLHCGLAFVGKGDAGRLHAQEGSVQPPNLLFQQRSRPSDGGLLDPLADQIGILLRHDIKY